MTKIKCEFRIGDIVTPKTTYEEAPYITLGEQYRVTGVFKLDGNECPLIEIIIDSGNTAHYFAWRFKHYRKKYKVIV